MSPRQAVLDALLLGQQPVERLVNLALGDLAKREHLAQAGVGALAIDRPDKSKLRARRHQSVDDQSNDQIAMAYRRIVLGGAQHQPVQGDLADHPKARRHVAVGQGPLDRQAVVAFAQHNPALQKPFQSGDQTGGKLAQVGDGPLLRLTVLVAIALAQKHGRR